MVSAYHVSYDTASSDLNPIHGQFRIIILNAIHRKYAFSCFTFVLPVVSLPGVNNLPVSHHVVYTTS
jgi:hypothetical protein